MAAASLLRYLYLAHVSRPNSVRQLYRLIKRHRVSRIVEIGMSDVRRSVALLGVAERYARQQKVNFTGIDWFDARGKEFATLSLKEAYRVLRATEANVRLVPGSPGQALAAAANEHQNTGLLLISADVSDSELQPAWFYIPRMLEPSSLVLRECRDSNGEAFFTRLSLAEVSERAGRAAGRRAA